MEYIDCGGLLLVTYGRCVAFASTKEHKLRRWKYLNMSCVYILCLNLCFIESTARFYWIEYIFWNINGVLFLPLTNLHVWNLSIKIYIIVWMQTAESSHSLHSFFYWKLFWCRCCQWAFHVFYPEGDTVITWLDKY